MNSIQTSFPHTGVFEINFQSKEGNSFRLSQLQQLATTIKECDKDINAKIIILKSTGKTFCAGANLEELISLKNINDAIAFFSGFANVILAIKNSPKLVLCMVQGKAIGGGLGLIAAADYVIANNQVSVKLSELSLGIGPFVIGPAVERKIGLSKYSALVLTPEKWKSAEWCLENGLINEVVDDDTLVQAAYDYAITSTQHSPQAISLIKKSFWENTGHWKELLLHRAELSAQLTLSPFCQNKLQSFIFNKS